MISDLKYYEKVKLYGPVMDNETQKLLFGLASVILGITGYIPYFIGIYKDQLRPHIFTWFLWGLLMVIIWLAQLKSHAGAGAWVTGISAFFCLVISIYAFRQGQKDITKFDWVCFISGLVSIPLWCLTNNALYAILLLTLIEAMAFFPTFRKSWLRPSEESALSYSIAGAKFAVSLFAIREFIFVNWFYPAVLVALNALLVITILYNRNKNQAA